LSKAGVSADQILRRARASLDFCYWPILLQKSGSKGVSAAPWIFEADARPLLSDSPRERLF